MMRKLTKAMLAGALAMLATAPLTAQTGDAAQTPENAHKFLNMILVGSKLGIHFGETVTSKGCLTTLVEKDQNDTIYHYIIWSQVRGVTVDGSNIVLGGGLKRLYSYQEKESFITPAIIDVKTPETAVRVRTAMEVIRKSCDPTAQTGF